MTYEEVASLRAELAAEKDKLAKVVGDNNHLRQAFQMLADEITVHSIDEPVIIRRIQAALEAAKEVRDEYN
jgi:RNA polymerase-interacting CarD/CdnL/TRCF family regulator